MCEVKVESRTRVEEHGRTVLYEKIYRGVPTQGGGLRLLAYYERRIPLAHMQMELRAVGHCSATRFLRNSDRIIEKK